MDEPVIIIIIPITRFIVNFSFKTAIANTVFKTIDIGWVQANNTTFPYLRAKMFKYDPKSKQTKPKIQYLVQNGLLLPSSVLLCECFINMSATADMRVPKMAREIAYRVKEKSDDESYDILEKLEIL